MTSSPSFFKSKQARPVVNSTYTPSNIDLDGRADFAVAIYLIDYLRTTTHQKNQKISDVLLEPLLHKLQENSSYEKPSIDYLTPRKYLQHVCSETDPNLLVPALADVLKQRTLEYVLANSREYTSAFLSTTPHTLTANNIETNTRCLNPLMPHVISRLIELPFHVSETSDNKTLPKKHPNAAPMLASDAGIKLHKQGEHCLVSVDIIDASHFKNLDKKSFLPTTSLCLDNIEKLIRHLSQEVTRSTETYNATKSKLQQYIATEKKSLSAMINTYFNHLDRRIKHPSTYFDTAHGTQAFFPNTTTHGLEDGLKGTLARNLVLGEPLNMVDNNTEKSNHAHTALGA